jgi:hypothetical protein
MEDRKVINFMVKTGVDKKIVWLGDMLRSVLMWKCGVAGMDICMRLCDNTLKRVGKGADDRCLSVES